MVSGCETGLGKAMAAALAKAGVDITSLSVVDDYSAVKAEVTATGCTF